MDLSKTSLELSCYGISGLTLKWIEAFLSNRRQRVIHVMHGENFSTWSQTSYESSLSLQSRLRYSVQVDRRLASKI